MKKTLIKTIAVSAVIFALSQGSVFAEGKKSARPVITRQGISKTSEKENGVKKAKNRKMPEFQKKTATKAKEKTFPRFDLLGTVSLVSSDSKIVTIKDADGKETFLHVNPLTKINILPTEAERKAKLEELKKLKNQSKVEKKSFEKPKAQFKKSDISDLKNGDWVMVKKIDTGTKTIEAGFITVVRE